MLGCNDVIDDDDDDEDGSDDDDDINCSDIYDDGCFT
jgi:hypothetical protein